MPGAAASRPDDVTVPQQQEPQAAPGTVAAFRGSPSAQPQRLPVRARPPDDAVMNAPSTPNLDEQDIHLFREGTHTRLYQRLGCRPDGAGARFAVWAPNARAVSVVGDFNDWRDDADPAGPRWDSSGIWERSVAAARPGQRYKFAIVARDGERLLKADPFARAAEVAPATASLVCGPSGYRWGDARWLARRGRANALDAPMSVYEVHLGSWRRAADGGFLGYRAIAAPLVAHVREAGFTHVELMPLTEHPFYGSWGYQTTGYFAPTSRYGSADDLKFLIDTLHQADIGVLLDWVPSHFPTDAHGLARFDGSFLFEHEDPRQGFHPEWNSSIFNYGRNEVRAFLLSGAHYWLDEFHVDGLRVDAVASMLYLDYSRRHGEWVPNRHGGRENLEAVSFLKQLTESVYRDHPDVQVIAEESTAWPMVSRPTYLGGLGFGLKWNMGWMHDTLRYFREDPVHRRWHHGELTFSMVYAFNENFMLPLSHDEVVHGKGSLIAKMPGDDWQQRANLRLLYGYMWAHPGKKLLFMGGEIGQRAEWAHEGALEWWRLDDEGHRGLLRWVHDLNRLYRETPALHQVDFEPAGFQWIDCNDAEASVLSFLRCARDGSTVLVVANFTPVPRDDFLVGVPHGGRWRERLNSDATWYGGSGIGNHGGVDAVPLAAHGRYQSLNLRLPPLSVLVLEPQGAG